MTANTTRLATQEGPQFVYFVRTFRQFTGHLSPHRVGREADSLCCHNGLFIICPSRKACICIIYIYVFNVLRIHFAIGHAPPRGLLNKAVNAHLFQRSTPGLKAESFHPGSANVQPMNPRNRPQSLVKSRLLVYFLSFRLFVSLYQYLLVWLQLFSLTFVVLEQ